MAFTTKLELRQSHSLVMTPQLQQAIKLLQLSNIELAAFVETELERNPLLEREESDESGSPLAPDAPEPAANLFEAAKEEMNGHAVDGAEASDSDASGGDEGEWLDLQAEDRGGRGEELDTEPQDAIPDGEGYSAGTLKETNWASLSQGPRIDGDEAPNLEA